MINRVLTTTAVIIVGLTGCETTPVDTSGLESKNAAVEGDSFGTCMAQSHEASVQLEEARAKLARLQDGSQSETVLNEGIAAADAAAQHRRQAEAACEQLMEPMNQRVAALEAVDADMRLARLEEVRETLQGVTFATGSAKLTESARVVLDVQANKLKRQPGTNVEIAGFASATGNPQRNLELSQRRAEAVRAFLIQSGVDANRLTARGYGIANPVASNDTAEGRRANQRIEMRTTMR